MFVIFLFRNFRPRLLVLAGIRINYSSNLRNHRYRNMKEEEVNHCQIQEWYPMFKSVSIKTLIHQLPESFIQHLLDDSGPFLLPVSVLNEDALPNRIHNPDEEEDFQVSEGSGDEAEAWNFDPPFLLLS
ncbi:hypothetical protein GLYMA_02G261300v4 [Glycine max]|nr:hypothetical protein GLYMA_02G261300v4 [Glycine max]